MPITEKNLEIYVKEQGQPQIKKLLNSDMSLEVLTLLRDVRTFKFKDFFLEYMNANFNGNFQERGLAGKIAKELLNNPFDNPPVNKNSLRVRVSRYIKGNTNLNRYYAYQICIAFKLALNHSKEFFKNYINMEFAPFNDWRDILYYYCIQKGHGLKETHVLYKRCIGKEVDLNESGQSQKDIDEETNRESVTVLTSVIHNAYLNKNFIDDEEFIAFMRDQKDNFHYIRGSRRKKLKEFLSDIEKNTFDGWNLIGQINNLFAGIFFEDDYEDYNRETPEDDSITYFREKIASLRGKSKKINFSREFFILCWLISGGDDINELDDILLDEYIKYSEISMTNFFDAMIYEACCYHERNKETSVYDRLCELTHELQYKLPNDFAKEKN